MLRLVPPSPEVSYIRRRKEAERETDFGSIAVLKTPADWLRFSRGLFGDDRYAVDEKPKRERTGNVIELPVRRRRSTSAEILQVHAEEVARGKHR